MSEEDIFKYKQSINTSLNTTSDVIIIDSDIDRRTRQEKYGKKGLQPKCSIKSDEVGSRYSLLGSDINIASF